MNNLYINRLMKELSFVDSDYVYKQDIINKNDSLFLEEINKFLDKNDELKRLYNDKINTKLEELINNQKIEITQENDKIETKDNQTKKIYREIVKLTHPDKTNDINNNEIYIKSTEYYKNNDIISLYKICDELNIKFELSDEDIPNIESNIKQLKDRINFIESTFTYRWTSANDKEKNNIILEYIRKII